MKVTEKEPNFSDLKVYLLYRSIVRLESNRAPKIGRMMGFFS
jgi:hypothetical protein